ncbi:hypothetical protein [Methylocystis echinoides]|uniref:Restriction endonuclease type IV Mrr domain-containing protein n=1 Tax=Methylocystis echinoides TaxID=29468 RepID=A0A9W6LTY2_9HYPH|nr:hypothetical protein [Methylocystis echinoides]RTL81035.1 MAG: hypothetical protein EKK29_18760 [Hyphomicrobiales bacterium]GLI95225.1 hypothetical protein LMG27198_42170 [Methylocystis echinoides]
MSSGSEQQNPSFEQGATDADASTAADARRLALEIIATLVNIKKTAADQLLRKAGVPDDLIRRFLTERDPATGEKRSKREAGAMVLEELTRAGADAVVVRRLIAIAAEWEGFHLAQDEYKARAVVQKAREVLGVLAKADARERILQEQRARENEGRRRRERALVLQQQSDLLLAQFDQASIDEDVHKRGYLLQDLLNRLFDLHRFPVTRAFQRNDGGEQIDGAFELEGWHYLVECRWRAKLADIREVDGLLGQVRRSGRQTMGLFLSINGWSEHVAGLLKQNPDKSILLMEGYDLRSVLAQQADLRELMKAKVRALNLDSEPYFSVARLVK